METSERIAPPEQTETQQPQERAVPIPISLVNMLSYCRSHGCEGEIKFLNKFIVPAVDRMLVAKSGKDETISAYFVAIPNADGSESTTLWSCHTDTVHAAADSGALHRQRIVVDHHKGELYKIDNKPLGADDGAGVWLLLEMISAKVPGTYIFHRGEEKGGIGSRAVAKNFPSWLKKFTHAIAFDRKKDCSIITFQSSGRCCSDKFANQMSQLLTDEDCTYILAPDDGGIFTDTANYIDLIPECTNISIGYDNEHSGAETLDVKYLLWLRDRMVSVFGAADAPVLEVHRDPSVHESKWGKSGWENYRNWSDRTTTTKTAPPRHSVWDVLSPLNEYDVDDMSWREMEDWIDREDPAKVSDLIFNLAEKVLRPLDNPAKLRIQVLEQMKELDELQEENDALRIRLGELAEMVELMEELKCNSSTHQP